MPSHVPTPVPTAMPTVTTGRNHRRRANPLLFSIPSTFDQAAFRARLNTLLVCFVVSGVRRRGALIECEGLLPRACSAGPRSSPGDRSPSLVEEPTTAALRLARGLPQAGFAGGSVPLSVAAEA
jgi:hypothetical protein